MAYCSKCGVKVASEISHCPLCKTPIHSYDEVLESSSQYPQYYKKKRLSHIERLFFIWLPFVVSIGVSIIILIIINLTSPNELWSKWPITALGTTGLLSTGFIFLYKKPILCTIWTHLCIAGMLYLFNYFLHETWFNIIASPIIIFSAFFNLTAILLLSLVKKNLPLYLSITTGIATLFFPLLEYRINIYRGAEILSWSLIAATPVAAISILLLFYSIYMRKRLNIKPYIHS